MKKFSLLLFGMFLIVSITGKVSAQHINGLSDRQIKDLTRALSTQHSIALAGVYNQLGTICIPREQIDQKIDIKTRTFVTGNLQSTVYDAINFSGTKMAEGVSISDHLRSLRYPFSPNLYNALDQLQQSLNAAINVNSFSVNIESFVDSKFPLLANNVEKFILAGAAYIGVDSYTYWDAEIDNWSLVIAQSMGGSAGFNMFKADPKSIATSDLAGAVTGLAKGAYIGLTAGTMTVPGIGTVAGGAACALTGLIGGAILSSASAGVKYLISRLFD